jgi:hypothetical protein
MNSTQRASHTVEILENRGKFLVVMTSEAVVLLCGYFLTIHALDDIRFNCNCQGRCVKAQVTNEILSTLLKLYSNSSSLLRQRGVLVTIPFFLPPHFTTHMTEL